MRAVMLRAPDELLEERRRTGADRWDEVWDGVLHMPPPPSGDHQLLGTELLAALLPHAKRSGLRMAYETGLFRTGAGERDYRVPDLIAAAPERWNARGVEGPAPGVSGRAPVVADAAPPEYVRRGPAPAEAFWESST